ncbi:hypothetical protein [Thalassobacillus sp. CUG 92003]|uniref:hypothetical protein n=1 Tax=Thalassobacillus sp. CUG 92003 TaxID=2736641 RepID=UPI0015E6C583|nr:hypothetical protein [Thalassobacillus sp. CUG 92003]
MSGEPNVESVRIAGCGESLKVQYVSDNRMTHVHVSPEVDNPKFNSNTNVTLKSGINAKYKEHDMLQALRFIKKERTYMIYIENNNGKMEKSEAIEYLSKVANSLVPV